MREVHCKEINLLLLPGDGVGPEVLAQAERVLAFLRQQGLSLNWRHASIGGGAFDKFGDPLPRETLRAALESDAVLMGAVGGPMWDHLPRDKRPETGLLRLRSELELFCNLRPTIVYDGLERVSSLKPGLVHGLDLMIVRELIGGIYFGQPRGMECDGEYASNPKAYNTMVYRREEIVRIARAAFAIARLRQGRICSVDKANVLEVSQLWRETVTEVAKDFPEVLLEHMYVDNAAMQLVSNPHHFDVILTGNLFGDILSDISAALAGSIGMLPSASLGVPGRALYEPVHGSAPDIAGQGIANPFAAILCVAMLLRHSAHAHEWATEIEKAIKNVVDQGICTADLKHPSARNILSTEQAGDAVLKSLSDLVS